MTLDKRQKRILLVAVILIGVNLRPAITAVGPLVPEIRIDTGLPNFAIGLLTTLPVLAFGVFSVFTPLFTRKIGTEGTMALALFLISTGLFLRIHPAVLALFGGTVLIGIGIALGNVLLPGIIKKQFPDKVGILTGVYSAMIGVGATVASGVSVPMSESLGLGWSRSLGSWGFLCLIALLFWLPQLRSNMPVVLRKGFRESIRQLSNSRLAWMVSIFMGVQSLTFYTLITWLPEILNDRGLTATEAGWLLALMQAVGIIGTLLIPAWASKLKNQRLPILVLSLFEIIALIGLLFPTLTLVGLWVSMMGFALGGSFGLALLLIVLRCRESTTANELSGMSQSVGYSLAATGPVLFGAIFDLFNSWLLPIGFLFLIVLLKLGSGYIAGKDETI